MSGTQKTQGTKGQSAKGPYLTLFPKLVRLSPVSCYNLVAEFICNIIMVDVHVQVAIKGVWMDYGYMTWGRLGRSIHGGYPFTGGGRAGDT
jgi:hypothetical protein